MDALNLDTLPLLLIFVVPGVIARKCFDCMTPGAGRDWTSSLPEVLAYSAINYGIWFWAIDLAIAIQPVHPWYSRLLIWAIIFISPVILGIGVNLLLRWKKMRRFVVHPTPTGWDHFFQGGKECWVLCHMHDGKSIGGLYRAQSMASSYPHPRDLYIEQVWRVDQRTYSFIEPVPDSAGTVVAMDNCKQLEFIHLRHD